MRLCRRAVGSLQPGWRKAQLAYILLKATGANPQPDAIVHVAGGPGAGSTLRDTAVEFIKRYAPLREDRDIILYDQRGMGNSLPFFGCGLPDEATVAAATAALEQRLGGIPTAAETTSAYCEQDRAARGFPASAISTQNSVADLVELHGRAGLPGV